jgi:mRNA-degrading endonuclease YafQ of YafQ-DinJ toxin-antitoxin module
LAKRHPETADDLQVALELLAEDAHHPALRTHKLKGKLSKSWACSAGYDLRIVFQFVRHGAQEGILLEAVGTHDQVY